MVSLLRRIDTVDGSLALVLYGPVANSRSEQSLFVASAGDAVRRDTGLDLVSVVLVLGLDALEAVEALFLLNLLESDKLIERLLADWNDLLEHVPENSFTERRGRQRALVGPSLLVLELHDEGGEVQPHECHVAVVVTVFVILSQLEKEPVVCVRVLLEVRVGNDLEEETEHSVGELRATFHGGRQGTLDAVHDVQLKVEQLTVNRVLGGCVEMRLHAVEHDLAVFEVFVK